MPWQLLVLLRVLLGYIIAPILLKPLAHEKDGRSRRFMTQFAFSTLIVWTYALTIGGFSFHTRQFTIILGIGFANGFAAYCLWRAYAINLSKTALATQADDLIGLTLAYIFLHEVKYFNNLWLVAGILLALGAAFLFAWEQRKNQLKALQEKITNGEVSEAQLHKPIALWVAGYSVIWGCAFCLIRYFAINNVTIVDFLTPWYTGSLVSAFIIFRIAGPIEAGRPLTPIVRGRVALLSTIIVLSLALQYWASQLAPVTVTQPLYQVTEMVFPALLGLYFFREIKSFSRNEKIAFSIGLLGGLLIALSYSGG